MKKTLTKFLAVVLSIATLLALCVTANAETTVGQPMIKTYDTYAAKGAVGIKFGWTKVTGAKGYEYRYSLNAETALNDADYVTRTTSKAAVKLDLPAYGDVRFQVRAYKKAKGGKVYGEWDTVSFSKAQVDAMLNQQQALAGSKLGQPTVKNPTISLNDESVQLKYSWSKVSGAKGYEYRYNLFWDGNAGEETFVTGTTDKRSASLSFQDSGDILFQVRAYKESKGELVYGKWETFRLSASRYERIFKAALVAKAIKISKPEPKTTKGLKLPDARGLKFTWGAIAGATGYEYRYNLFYGKQSGFSTGTTKENTVSIGFQDNGTVMFEVRAYKAFNGQKVVGKWYSYKLTPKAVSKLID